ncbi:hypothetical protein D3C86_1910010 [compost metagenome]
MTFTVKDIGRDVGARNEFLQRGFRGTPVVVIDDQAIVGFDRARIDRALSLRTAHREEGRPVDIIW